MDRFTHEDRQPYTDVSTVESQRNDLIPEEFPEGPYGSGMRVESLGKSKPWRIDQRSSNQFDYENRTLHAGMSRDYPGEDDYNDAIPEVHDEP
ncbi:hypothetical protein L1N85_03005 [Paenibacillus alkaliterrae]|uniref:hypothetical protein n=1 Tax=Paenibacillus alkaliterrae TaxID=320909 RepID=UPI001F2F2191|nr:hypothetical protein [Paenibacillus alkaliterrae]MCF2937397.1 hypothetical protein [Paenibacillus alkaliterrae]